MTDQQLLHYTAYRYIVTHVPYYCTRAARSERVSDLHDPIARSDDVLHERRRTRCTRHLRDAIREE